MKLTKNKANKTGGLTSLLKLLKSKILRATSLSRFKFSKIQLLSFGVVFAVIGGYIIYRSFAATSPSAPTTTNPPPQITSQLPGSSPPPPPNGTVIWNGDFSTGDLSQYNGQFCTAGQGPPVGVQVVTNPVRPGYQFSAMFSADDTSIKANCPQLQIGPNPTAFLHSKHGFIPGDDVYIAYSVLFPSGGLAPWPSNICTPPPGPACHIQISEIYGPPSAGSPPFDMNVLGNRLNMPTHYWGRIWTDSSDIIKDQWYDIEYHEHFATDMTGFIELWLNGVQQTFKDGSTRFNLVTLDPTINWNGTPNTLALDTYIGANTAAGTGSNHLVILYEAAAKVGTTYAAAAPSSSPPPSPTPTPTPSPTPTPPPASPTVQGDCNGDGTVNLADLSILLSHYDAFGATNSGDFNGDGTVNLVDLSILLSHYGS